MTKQEKPKPVKLAFRELEPGIVTGRGKPQLIVPTGKPDWSPFQPNLFETDPVKLLAEIRKRNPKLPVAHILVDSAQWWLGTLRIDTPAALLSLSDRELAEALRYYLERKVRV